MQLKLLLLFEHPKQNSKALYAILLEDAINLTENGVHSFIDQSKIGMSLAKLYLSCYLFSAKGLVLSPGYRHLPSACQCVLPSIESIKAYKQLFCLNSLK